MKRRKRIRIRHQITDAKIKKQEGFYDEEAIINFMHSRYDSFTAGRMWKD